MGKWIKFDYSNGYEESPVIPDSTEAANRNVKMTDAECDRQGLEDSLYEILRHTIDEIQAGWRWQATPEVRAAEGDINPTFFAVVSGQKTVADFRAVCNRWKEAGIR